MSFSGHRTRTVGLAVLASICLAVRGLCAVEGSTASTGSAPASHPAGSATVAGSHVPPKNTATHTTASHYAPKRNSAPHTGTAHITAAKTTPHASASYSGKAGTHHSTAYSSQHKSSSAQGKYSSSRRYSTLSGQQRLARLHLQPERVQEIQQALIHEGYLEGDANGQWDTRTHDAMLRYQTTHGFPATGLPEAKSLMKLGLGSHPLPAELDHGTVGVVSPGAPPGELGPTPASPPVSQALPPS